MNFPLVVTLALISFLPYDKKKYFFSKIENISLLEDCHVHKVLWLAKKNPKQNSFEQILRNKVVVTWAQMKIMS